MNSRGRSSLVTTVWVILIIVLALIAIVLVKLTSSDKPAPLRANASPELLAKVTKLDANLFTKVGEGSASKLPTPISDGTAYTSSDGKPQVLYIGAEYCPYCATERWPMVIALSRFGTFTDLGTTTSSATDAYPSTATFSFHGASYKSDYLSFTAVEEMTNQSDGNGSYTKLDTPTSEQQALITKYDAPPYTSSTNTGSIPFMYFGGKYVMVGSNYDPSILQSKTQDQIASSLTDTSSSISKGVIGAANTITATLCQLTDNKPANVCSNSTISGLQAKLGS